MKDPTVEYIDTISDFFNQRAIVKSMFDKKDHSGVHISPDGSKKIQEKIREFIKALNDIRCICVIAGPFSWKYTTNTNQGVGKVTFDLSNSLCQ
jgi:CRISPR/Cas system-associated protein Csx1